MLVSFGMPYLLLRLVCAADCVGLWLLLFATTFVQHGRHLFAPGSCRPGPAKPGPHTHTNLYAASEHACVYCLVNHPACCAVDCLCSPITMIIAWAAVHCSIHVRRSTVQPLSPGQQPRSYQHCTALLTTTAAVCCQHSVSCDTKFGCVRCCAACSLDCIHGVQWGLTGRPCQLHQCKLAV